MQDINIALVQVNLAWEDKTANLAKFENIFRNELVSGTDIIVLPEMFTTGFTMEPLRIAERMNGHSMEWLSRWAAELNAAIVGSLVIEDNRKFWNRLVWMQPDGQYFTYDKRHTFTLAGENRHYGSGKTRLIVEYKDWVFMPVICYDLRFPVWLRNTEDYDCLVVVANWPEKRIMHWDKLLIARAIENQSYALAVNRVGDDINKTAHNGCTMAVDPMGREIVRVENEEKVLHVTLKRDEIEQIRQGMPFLHDRDNFEIL